MLAALGEGVDGLAADRSVACAGLGFSWGGKTKPVEGASTEAGVKLGSVCGDSSCVGFCGSGVRWEKGVGGFVGCAEGATAENKGLVFAWLGSVAGAGVAAACGVKLKIGLGGSGWEDCWNRDGLLSEALVGNLKLISFGRAKDG